MIRRRKPLKRTGIKRKPPKKKRAKSELVLFKKELWRKFAAYVKERDGNTCFVCGKTGLEGKNWQAAHVFSAGSYNALRWRFDNVFSGCYGCNVGKHGNYIEYHRLYKERFGEAAYADLYDHRYDFKKWTLDDLMEIDRKIESESTNVTREAA